MVSAPDRYFSPHGWWKNRDGRKTFLHRVDEDRRDLARNVTP